MPVVTKRLKMVAATTMSISRQNVTLVVRVQVSATKWPMSGLVTTMSMLMRMLKCCGCKTMKTTISRLK